MAIENSFKYFNNTKTLIWILLVKYACLLLMRKWLLLNLKSITVDICSSGNFISITVELS